MTFLARMFGKFFSAATPARAMNPRLQEFNAQAKAEGFTVDLCREVARVIRYEDREGRLSFTFDLGSQGDRTLALEWPRGVERWHIPSREKTAFERARRFLEACGHKVERWPPELEGRHSDQAKPTVDQMREQVEKAGYSLERLSDGQFVVRRETKKE